MKYYSCCKLNFSNHYINCFTYSYLETPVKYPFVNQTTSKFQDLLNCMSTYRKNHTNSCFENFLSLVLRWPVIFIKIILFFLNLFLWSHRLLVLFLSVDASSTFPDLTFFRLFFQRNTYLPNKFWLLPPLHSSNSFLSAFNILTVLQVLIS